MHLESMVDGFMLPQEGTHRSWLDLSLSTVSLSNMPLRQLAGRVPVSLFLDSCSICRAVRFDHVSGSMPAVRSWHCVGKL